MMDALNMILTYALRADIGEVVKKTESDLIKIINKTMTKEEIREHWADIVAAVFDAEGRVTPTLQERKNALGNNPTDEQINNLAREECLAVADEILSRTSEEELKELY